VSWFNNNIYKNFSNLGHYSEELEAFAIQAYANDMNSVSKDEMNLQILINQT
jgi:hypothetical protein